MDVAQDIVALEKQGIGSSCTVQESTSRCYRAGELRVSIRPTAAAIVDKLGSYAARNEEKREHQTEPKSVLPKHK